MKTDLLQFVFTVSLSPDELKKPKVLSEIVERGVDPYSPNALTLACNASLMLTEEGDEFLKKLSPTELAELTRRRVVIERAVGEFVSWLLCGSSAKPEEIMHIGLNDPKIISPDDVIVPSPGSGTVQ